MLTSKKISCTRIQRIRAQGYSEYSDQQISGFAIGNRFAYQVCTVLLFTSVVSSSLTLFTVMLSFAFLSIFLPNHVFDYFYNYAIAPKWNYPKLPPRSKQLKFACTVASLWIACTIYLLYYEFQTAATVMGACLVGVAALVSTLDYCIPSVIYNTLFTRENQTTS